MIRQARPSDAEAIVSIYNHYVTNTTISFEESPVSVKEMEGRIHEVMTTLPWLVLEEQGQVLGYAYATKWRVRHAYRYSVESTVYLDKHVLGRGHGRSLYSELLKELKERSVHCVIGGITQPNAASVALHEKMGFEKVAHFKQVGWKFEKWLDVGYWELIL
jgi:phosphinothricin acetyltransferase